MVAGWQVSGATTGKANLERAEAAGLFSPDFQWTLSVGLIEQVLVQIQEILIYLLGPWFCTECLHKHDLISYFTKYI